MRSFTFCTNCSGVKAEAVFKMAIVLIAFMMRLNLKNLGGKPNLNIFDTGESNQITKM
jgi:hypothetical protein